MARKSAIVTPVKRKSRKIQSPTDYSIQFDDYLNHCEERNLTQGTVESYRFYLGYLKRYLQENQHSLLVDEIKERDLKDFLNFMRKMKGNNQATLNSAIASLSNLDNKFRDLPACKYVRYVDDILILCKKEDYYKIQNNIVYELDHYLNLKVSSEVGKTIHGEIAEGFTFLGYTKNADGFTVRESSVNKFKDSLSQLFTQFKYSKNRNLEILLWKINLKVTGCINEGRKYGWLFFFSQINDTKLLFELDWLIKKYFINAGFEKEYSTLQIKRFVKAHKEITLNLSRTSYIPTFDSFTFIEKKKLLMNIFKQDISGMKTEQIDWLFKKMIYNSIKDLEKDIQPIS